jgi:hypothetical protein
MTRRHFARTAYILTGEQEESPMLVNRRFDSVLASLVVLGLAVGDVWSHCPSTTIAPGPGGEQYFGRALAVDENVAVIGQLGFPDASVAVYRRLGDRWTREARLEPPSYDFSFGLAVDVDGDRIAVGAEDWPGLDAVTGGIVWIYEYDGFKWNETARLRPPVIDLASDFGGFGEQVALDGDRLAVGDSTGRLDDTTGKNEGGAGLGVVHVFERGSSGWTRVQLVQPQSQPPYFGGSVALDDNRMIVDSRAGLSDEAFIFRRSADGSWVEEAALTGSSAEELDRFGAAVDIEGDLAVVGTPGLDGIDYVSGGAFVFRRSASNRWVEEARLLPPDVDEYNQFGRAVTIDGDRIVARTIGFFDSDGLYVYERRNDVWRLERKLVESELIGDVLAADAGAVLAWTRAGGGQPGVVRTACPTCARRSMGPPPTATATAFRTSVSSTATTTVSRMSARSPRASIRTATAIFFPMAASRTATTTASPMPATSPTTTTATATATASPTNASPTATAMSRPTSATSQRSSTTTATATASPTLAISPTARPRTATATACRTCAS